MIIVRQELINDYKKIAEITAQAFHDDYVGEVTLIDSLRSGARFDPELSLVALKGDEVIGHVLFYPQTSFIRGMEVTSVVLGPISVVPEYQKIGVGRLLIQEGHKVALKKEYKFSFLWGHPTYYPRFSYMTDMFGQSIAKIDLREIEENDNVLKMRRVEKTDIESLLEMWNSWYRPVDLAVKPSDLLLDWINNYSNIVTRTFVKDDEVVGYIRYHKENLDDIKMFLSKDKETTLMMLAHLKKKFKLENIVLPIYKTNYVKDIFKDIKITYTNTPWKACMIAILDESNDLINEYCQDIIEKSREIGQIILPPQYEME